MLTNDFKGISLSRLGFGTMRLPLLTGREDGPVLLDWEEWRGTA